MDAVGDTWSYDSLEGQQNSNGTFTIFYST